MKSRPRKPDDRRDNADRIKNNIDMTIHNMELADEMLAKTSNLDTKQELEAKNERRRQALDGMRSEIRDETKHQEQKHQ
jgi:small acid-soluble spore protein (thioredoxin-like protein)